MSLYAKYAATPATRANFLNLCLISYASDYVFEFLIGEYKKSPTKTRLIALFEVFCDDKAVDAKEEKKGNMFDQSGIGDLLMNGQDGLKQNATDSKGKDRGATLRELYKKYRSLKDHAAEMNVFKRVWTAKERIPPADLFDYLLPHIFERVQEDRAKMNAIVERLKGGSIPNVIETELGERDGRYTYFRDIWAPARQKLITAGFAALNCTWSSLRIVLRQRPARLRRHQEEKKHQPPPVAKKPIPTTRITTKNIPETRLLPPNPLQRLPSEKKLP